MKTELQTFKRQLLEKHGQEQRSAIYYLRRLIRNTGKHPEKISIDDLLHEHQKQKNKNNSPKKLYMMFFDAQQVETAKTALDIEIDEYKQFITDPVRTWKNPKMLQKPATFEALTRYNINCFLKYLNNQGIVNIDSLCEPLQNHLVPYIKNLYAENPTQTIWIRTRTFSNMLEYYYGVDVADMKNEISQLKRLPIRAGKNAYKQYIYETYDLKTILNHVQKCKAPKPRLIFEILLRCGWRSANVRNLNIGKNLIYDGSDWFYQFAPDEQKAPQKINHVEQPIIGKLPSAVAGWLEKYLCGSFRHGNIFAGSPSWLNTYIKRECEKIGLPRLNPHSFRHIVSNNYFHSTRDLLGAETFLWHQLSVSKSSRHYLRSNFDDAVKMVNEYLDSLASS